jgi:hypothetical protein
VGPGRVAAGRWVTARRGQPWCTAAAREEDRVVADARVDFVEMVGLLNGPLGGLYFVKW